MSEEEKSDKDPTFDMYHFFSRKDVILIAALVIFFLLIALFKFLTGGQAV